MKRSESDDLNPRNREVQDSSRSTANEESKIDNATLVASFLRRLSEPQHQNLHPQNRTLEQAPSVPAVQTQFSGQAATVGSGKTIHTLQTNVGPSAGPPSTSLSNAASDPTAISSALQTASSSSSARSALQLQLLMGLLSNQQGRVPPPPVPAPTPTPAMHEIEAALQMLQSQGPRHQPLPSNQPSAGLSTEQVLLALGQQRHNFLGTQPPLRLHQHPSQQPLQESSARFFPHGSSNGAASLDSMTSELLRRALQPPTASNAFLRAAPLPIPRVQPTANYQDPVSRLLSASLNQGGVSSISIVQNDASSTSPLPRTLPQSESQGPRERNEASPAEPPSTASKTKKRPSQQKRGHTDESESKDEPASSSTEHSSTKRQKRAYHHESFPVKLHRLLRETEEAGKADIVSFSRDGKEFCVHKPTEFESQILPKYFRHNQLSSFRRLLNMYGFLRLQDGGEGGTFRHPSFLKDKPELCKDLDRVR